MTGADPRRIALITSSFHPHSGGVETHVRAVARELDRRGHSVEVWTVDRGERLGEAVVDGVRVRYLPTPLPARRARALMSFAASAPAAFTVWWRAFRALRPQLLHVHCFGPNGIYALALHRLTRTPLVVTSHGETFADDHGIFDRSALLRSALRRALSAAVAVTAPSEFVLSDLRSRFDLVGGTVVPNGIDLETSLTESVSVGGSGPVIVAVGRLGWMKGFDLLLEAAARPELSGARVVIAGDGEQEVALREQADRLGLRDRAHFVGRLTPEEVAAVMTTANAVVVPSRQEAFGIVALEAWRSGTPLVGTIHGGMSDFVTDGIDGLIVDPTDTKELASAVRSVLTDRALAARLVTAGSTRVRGFSWRRVADVYSDLYQGRRHG